MADIAPPDEAEILSTAVTASPLAADAPVKIPVHRYMVGMVEFAPPEEAEILGTALTASPLAADAPR